MRYAIESGVRHFALFAAVFLAASAVRDLFTHGWGGIDLAGAWASVGSFLPVWFAVWFTVWGALSAAAAYGSRRLSGGRSSAEDEGWG